MPSLISRSAVAHSRHHVRSSFKQPLCCTPRKSLVTLAIETSCDDTSVAVAELQSPTTTSSLKVHFHKTVTAISHAYGGIHPLVALRSHRTNLAPLLQEAVATTPKPDLIAATRGPGMRNNLATGLDTAKGLALAYDLPFIGVHHMQAHALTARLVSAMYSAEAMLSPEFPFLSVLVSGGHTMLINSTGLTDHRILAETQDIAIGDCLDKAARAIVPTELLKPPYGRALEDFAFPNGVDQYDYTAPARRGDEIVRRETTWGWSLPPPLAESKGLGKSSTRMIYSFAGLLSAVERSMRRKYSELGMLTDDIRPREDVSLDERRALAREVQRVAFEHLASRILLHLAHSTASDMNTIVVSGGVASNAFLRRVLRGILDARGYAHIQLTFPPVSLCTDNALMIAWAAMEMWLVGYRSTLDVEPLRKWSMDPTASDGGILGVGGWLSGRTTS